MRINFSEVAIRRTVHWIEDGKRKRKTKKFWQTISPFNKNKDGSIKHPKEILAELEVEAAAWEKNMKESNEQR